MQSFKSADSPGGIRRLDCSEKHANTGGMTSEMRKLRRVPREVYLSQILFSQAVSSSESANPGHEASAPAGSQTHFARPEGLLGEIPDIALPQPALPHLVCVGDKVLGLGGVHKLA